MKKKQAKSLVNKTIDLALDILAFIVALTIDALTWVARKEWYESGDYQITTNNLIQNPNIK